MNAWTDPSLALPTRMPRFHPGARRSGRCKCRSAFSMSNEKRRLELRRIVAVERRAKSVGFSADAVHQGFVSLGAHRDGPQFQPQALDEGQTFTVVGGLWAVRHVVLGGGLFVLRPAGLRGLAGDLRPAAVRQRFESTLPSDFSALSPHFGHHLRNDGSGGFLGFDGRFRGSDGLQNHAAGMLNGVQLGRAFPLRHGSRSHGQPHFVKPEAISN